MAFGCSRAYGVLVDLDAESRAREALDVAVDELEHLRVDQVVEQRATAAVLDAEALLLDQEVRYRQVDLQACCQGDGAQGAVWSHRDIVGLGHRGDPSYLGNAAGVGEVRLGNGDAGGQDVAE